MTSLLKHEDNLPLIAFTTLSPLAVGGLIGLLLEGASGFAPAVVFGVALLALAASVLHLGHPTRAYRALLGVATSWLSREVALFTLFLFCLFVYVLAVAVGPFQWLAPFAGIVGAAFGLLALFASGKLYQLQARPAWDHWTAVVSFPA